MLASRMTSTAVDPMQIHQLRNSLEHVSATDDEGILRGVRVRVVAGEGITVWAGILDPAAVNKLSCDISAGDFSARTVVHFVSWHSVQAYYAGTRFSSLIDSIKQRTLRFSTIPSSKSTDDETD